MRTQPPEKNVGFAKALALITKTVRPLSAEFRPLDELTGLTAAQDASAQVYCPSLDSSRKEGYAVVGAEIASASEHSPVFLQVSGLVTAGDVEKPVVSPGQAVRVTTGAPLPIGADAVLADEFTQVQGDRVVCLASAHPGRNVLPKGADVVPGDVLCRAGEVINPGVVGLLASGGVAGLQACPLPRVAVLATGSEVAQPGDPLPPGGLYASNMSSLTAWLQALGMAGPSKLVADDLRTITEACADLLQNSDALVTSGGTGHGERDLLSRAMADIGVEIHFSGVRLGPGKGAVFGMLGSKPVFCLPGGPPACLVAFMLLALPALQVLAGRKALGLPKAWVCLGHDAKGQPGWTNVIQGELNWSGEGPPVFEQLNGAGRLESIARATTLLRLGEDVTHMSAGSCLMAEMINTTVLGA